jgi:hypothetical protein
MNNNLNKLLIKIIINFYIKYLGKKLLFIDITMSERTLSKKEEDIQRLIMSGVRKVLKIVLSRS